MRVTRRTHAAWITQESVNAKLNHVMHELEHVTSDIQTRKKNHYSRGALCSIL